MVGTRLFRGTGHANSDFRKPYVIHIKAKFDQHSLSEEPNMHRLSVAQVRRVSHESRSSKTPDCSSSGSSRDKIVSTWRRLPSYHKTKMQALNFIDNATVDFSLSFSDVMVVATAYAIFSIEINTLFFNKHADGVFGVLSILVVSLFIFELAIATWTKTDLEFVPITVYGVHRHRCAIRKGSYLFSFFFWLDLAAIISMLPELIWNREGGGLIIELVSQGRLGKLARMVRLVRVVKLYKTSSKSMGEARKKAQKVKLMELVKNGEISLDEYVEQLLSTNQVQEELRVDRKLSAATMKTVIVLVFTMLFVFPWLTFQESEPHQGPLYSMRHTQTLNRLNAMKSTAVAVSELTSRYRHFDPAAASTDTEYLVYLELTPYAPSLAHICTASIENENLASVCLDRAGVLASLRTYEKFEILISNNDCRNRPAFSANSSSAARECSSRAILSLRPLLREQATLQVMTTVFVGILLLVGVLVFQSDAENLILEPVKSMMNLVQTMTNDGVSADEFMVSMPMKGPLNVGAYELHTIQTAMSKITRLLQVGFGQAGSEIIKTYLKLPPHGGGGDERGSDSINFISGGRRVHAIFGFCDILGFDCISDLLQTEIMAFINAVAAVVHHHVARCGGECNKNLGNSFLLVWRVPPGSGHYQRRGTLIRQHAGTNRNIDFTRDPRFRKICDKALLAFVRIIADLNRDPVIVENYRSHPELSKNGKPFRVRMGFGLHVGWAIEGAVGSSFKVDATYLSPHVNMAARLETASRQFGVPILMSEMFHKCLSAQAQRYCRLLDRIQVKGSAQAMDVLTYDVDEDAEIDDRTSVEDTRFSYDPDSDAALWDTDPDFHHLRRHVDVSMLQLHQSGMQNYLRGDWKAAAICFLAVDQKQKEKGYRGDSPSQTLLDFMMSYEYTAPQEWHESKGRVLMNK